MKSLIVVGSDYEKTKDLAKRLAQALSFSYFDLKGEFKKFLVDTASFPLILADPVLERKEKEILINASGRENAVCSLKDDMFLSNGNFLVFHNNFVILLKCNSAEPIDVSLEKLISSKVDLIVEESDDVDNLARIVKQKLGI